tara:strand:- start:48145 stop:48585 length:441 start_codon:yes stop_codon:yes gene_type:complete
MNGLVAAHSGLRYIVLVLLLVAIVNAIMNMNKNSYQKKDKLINLFAMVSLHIQLVLGLILYFVSPKVQFVEGLMGNANLRFFAVEHIALMLLSIILITLGRKRAEKHPNPDKKHKLILRYYGLGLILIFIAIPWPFIYETLGAGYF